MDGAPIRLGKQERVFFRPKKQIDPPTRALGIPATRCCRSIREPLLRARTQLRAAVCFGAAFNIFYLERLNLPFINLFNFFPFIQCFLCLLKIVETDVLLNLLTSTLGVSSTQFVKGSGALARGTRTGVLTWGCSHGGLARRSVCFSQAALRGDPTQRRLHAACIAGAVGARPARSCLPRTPGTEGPGGPAGCSHIPPIPPPGSFFPSGSRRTACILMARTKGLGEQSHRKLPAKPSSPLNCCGLGNGHWAARPELRSRP